MTETAGHRRKSQILAYADVDSDETDFLRNKMIKLIVQWSQLLECYLTNREDLKKVCTDIVNVYLAWKNASKSNYYDKIKFRRTSMVTNVELILPTTIQGYEEELNYLVTSIGLLMLLKYGDPTTELYVSAIEELKKENNINDNEMNKFLTAALVISLSKFWEVQSKISTEKQAIIESLIDYTDVIKSEQIEDSATIKGVKWIDLDEEAILNRETRNEYIRLLTLPSEARNHTIDLLLNFIQSKNDTISEKSYHDISKAFDRWCAEAQFIEDTPLLGPDRLAHKISRLEQKLTVTMCNLILLIKHHFEDYVSVALISLLNTDINEKRTAQLWALTIKQFESLYVNIRICKRRRESIGVVLNNPNVVSEPLITPASALLAVAKAAFDY